MKATLVAAFALIAGFNVYNSKKAEPMSELALANVEALARLEQPNVDDCISDPDYEALHPTDPSKYKRRQQARW